MRKKRLKSDKKFPKNKTKLWQKWFKKMTENDKKTKVTTNDKSNQKIAKNKKMAENHKKWQKCNKNKKVKTLTENYKKNDDMTKLDKKSIKNY